VKAGAVKCLLITSPERSQAMPDATSLGEVGAAETASDLWRGIIAPRAVPADRLTLLEKGFRQARTSASRTSSQAGAKRSSPVRGRLSRSSYAPSPR
jgi:tripartite-type tricarboxylate transporter receptor subunit TctC